MSQEEVIDIMGKPAVTEAAANKLVLVYGWDDPWDGGVGATEEYYVRLVDSVLESYGRLPGGSRASHGLNQVVDGLNREADRATYRSVNQYRASPATLHEV